MKIKITEIAKREFLDAKSFYDLEQPGLGVKYKSEIEEGLLRIKRFPEAWHIEHAEIHRYLTHRFPYKILYVIENDVIVVLAFAHQHRAPDYWIDRIEKDAS